MAVNIPPRPNHWYMNQVGKLMKVRMLSYDGNQPCGVLIEYLEGNTVLLSIDEWQQLDLNQHTWTPGDQQASV